MVPVIGVLLVFGFFPQPIVQLVQPVATASMQAAAQTDPAPQVEGVK
jgi:NADH-quinone oxidoreductase subunit M